MRGRFGAFGKIPTLGDFFRLALPISFVEPWDHWLQAGILSTREKLGVDWNDCYLSAPIWRFTLPAGQAGPQVISGVIMASVDRVGRQFPLTLAAPVETSNSAEHHFGNIPVFDQLEQLALSALGDSITREGLAEGLDELSFRASLPVTATRHPGGRVWQSNLSPIPMLAAQTVAGDAGYWSATLGDDYRILQCDQLPNAAQIRGLFDLKAPIWASPMPEPAL